MKYDEKITNEFEDYIIDRISQKVISSSCSDRSRIFTILVYKDTTTYNYIDVLNYFISQKYCAYIFHDRDLKEDLDGVVLDENKKAHYHIVVKYDNCTTPNAISKKSGVPINYIQSVKSERQVLRYLTHIDHPNKYQYSIDDIFVTKLYHKTVISAYDDLKSEEEQMILIKNFITTLKGNYFDNLFNTILFVNSNGYNKIYKRYEKEFQTLIKSID